MKLSPTDVLVPDPEIRFIRSQDGMLLAGSTTGIHVLSAPVAEQAQRLISRLDGVRTVGSVCQEPDGDLGPDQALALLQSISGRLVHRRQPETPPRLEEEAREVSVLLLGNGEIASRLQSLLSGSAAPGSRIEALLFPAGAGPLAELELLLPRFEVVVSALEDVPFRTLYETSLTCLRAGVPFVPVTVNADHALVGPTVIPGETPCVGCAHTSSSASPDLTLDRLLAYTEPMRTRRLCAAEGSSPQLDRVVRALGREVEALLGGPTEPELLTQVLTVPAKGEAKKRPVLRRADCPLCSRLEPQVRLREKVLLRARIEVAAAHEAIPRATAPGQEEMVRTIGVLGGGTAGYLTALGLRKRHPELSITLIESSEVPIIGVGEATTPAMPFFLHQSLGFDIHELFAEVQPTFKLGIRFDWGGDSFFNYPFGSSHVLEAALYDGHIRDYSLYSMLMSADAFPLAATGDGDYLPLLNRSSAYHLDNARFVRYLARKAREAGIEHLDLTLTDVELTEDGTEVASVISRDGRRLSFDLYVDCTGFRSLLLEKGLGSRFVPFDGTLFTDTAVVAAAPHHGRLVPYTRAQALSCGWCWSIPQMEEDHRGYVFSSAFCTAEEAAAEMRRCHPEMGDYRTVRFRSGRHEHFWKGNVVAIGNSYAFVEPLESTALHMVIQEIGLLAEALPLRKGDFGVQHLLNRKVNDNWDYLRWFLGLHYKFNRKLSSPFWQACREEVDVSLHQELIACFQERGPLSYTSGTLFDYPDPLWGSAGVDVILLGQEVKTRLPRPSMPEAQWRQGREVRQAIVSRALRQKEALEVWQARPELRDRYVDELRVVG